VITPATPAGAASPLFAGYGRPKYTQIPNLFLDQQVQDLNPSEIRVLLYIFRRTFGWQEDGAAIQASHFTKGRSGKDGRPQDRGAGLSENSFLTAARSLEAKGIIFRHKQYHPQDGSTPTYYELNIDGQPHCTEQCTLDCARSASDSSAATPPPKLGGPPPPQN